MYFPEIDYETHPAYSPYRSKVGYDDRIVDQQVQVVDQINSEYCAITNPSERLAMDAISGIQSALQQVLLQLKKQGISVVAEEWLHSCVHWTVADVSYELMRRVFSGREYRKKTLSARQAEQLSAMQSQGMYITDLPADTYDEIQRLAMRHFQELKVRAVNDPLNRSVANVSFNSSLWKAIKRAAQESGILDVLSEFKRNRMTLLGAGLEYSCSEQRWYHNLYTDVGLASSPFQYLHVDEGYCLPKSMIYVTPVRDENGPTRAIPGSNCWEVSECKVRMHRALDRVVSDRYAKFCSNGEYRTLARYPELRRIFMELPRAFRGSSHFGDDVLPGTEIANTLDRLEVPYLSEGGQSLVFDGPHLLHRGSLVRSGERMALQVIYRNRSEERIKAHLSKETFIREQLALGRKYARRLVMEYV